jgi:hypothetical protein
MTVRGVFGGVLALTFLQAVLSSDQATARTGGLIKGVTAGFDHFMNPTVALIPDLRKSKKWNTEAPGEIGQNPLATIPQSSATSSTSTTLLPASWTTRPAPPRAV